LNVSYFDEFYTASIVIRLITVSQLVFCRAIVIVYVASAVKVRNIYKVALKRSHYQES